MRFSPNAQGREVTFPLCQKPRAGFLRLNVCARILHRLRARLGASKRIRLVGVESVAFLHSMEVAT